MPRDVLLDKCKRYQRRKENRFIEQSCSTRATSPSSQHINSEYRGLVEYYRMAYNLHTLNWLKWVMETSLTKTLANKHKTSVAKIYKQYQARTIVDGKELMILQKIVPREGKKPLIAIWGGISLSWNIQANPKDQGRPNWNDRYPELEKRLLGFSRK